MNKYITKLLNSRSSVPLNADIQKYKMIVQKVFFTKTSLLSEVNRFKHGFPCDRALPVIRTFVPACLPHPSLNTSIQTLACDAIARQKFVSDPLAVLATEYDTLSSLVITRSTVFGTYFIATRAPRPRNTSCTLPSIRVT